MLPGRASCQRKALALAANDSTNAAAPAFLASPNVRRLTDYLRSEWLGQKLCLGTVRLQLADASHNRKHIRRCNSISIDLGHVRIFQDGLRFIVGDR